MPKGMAVGDFITVLSINVILFSAILELTNIYNRMFFIKQNAFTFRLGNRVDIIVIQMFTSTDLVVSVLVLDMHFLEFDM